MKALRALLPAIPVLTLFVGSPAVLADSEIQASGFTTAEAPGPQVTFLGAANGVASLRIDAKSLFSGTFVGESTSVSFCQEQLATGAADCVGGEAFSGTIAGRPAAVKIADVFTINFNTFFTQGRSTIINGEGEVIGRLSFAGNAAQPLPYSGKIELDD